MRGTLAAAVGLIGLGGMKFADTVRLANRTPELEDYLALRCSPEVALSHDFGVSLLHCWGCYAMGLGAAIIIVSVGLKLMLPRQGRGHGSLA